MIESYHDLVRRDVFDLLPSPANHLLDFGGGIGATSAQLKQEGHAHHITLFDQVADQAVDAVDVAQTIDLNDNAALGNLLDACEPFDCILALDIFEHLQDPWAAMQLLSDALKPGGSMVISLPNIAHISVLAKLILGRFDYQDAGIMDRTHLRWFTPKTAREFATHTGLILREEAMNYAGRKFRYPAQLSLGLLDSFCATQIKMRVEKSN